MVPATARLERLSEQSAFSAFVSHAQAKLQPLIEAYLARFTHPSEKAIKDAVWGMIDLTPSEVTLIDSPIFQRLRRIRQLGVSYLTYPTACHSRFEHTIGAMHQAERLIRAIAQRSPARDDILRSSKIARLAALLHDIGHLPFSHVGERYFSEKEGADPSILNSIMALQKAISRQIQVPTRRLAECLSVVLAMTPSMAQLMELAGYNPDERSEAILCVLGAPPALERAYLFQIITNIIDADKLDYMFRDALFTGIPVAIDLERLVYKLTCRDVDASSAPEHLKKSLQVGERIRLLATDLAGRRHARDLALARSMLFETVYHHHKTLAAERVALAILNLTAPHPVDLLFEDDTSFLRSAPDASHARYVAMLVNRNLPKRAFAASYGFLLENASRQPGQRPVVPDSDKYAWHTLTSLLHNYAERAKLEKAIQESAQGFARDLGHKAENITVWVDTPPADYELSDIELLSVRPDGTLLPTDPLAPEAVAFAGHPKAMSFVYVDGSVSVRELVFIATEILFARFKAPIHFRRQAADYAKLDWRAIQRHKRQLESKEFSLFAGARIARPESELGRSELMRPRLEALAAKFVHYTIDSEILIDIERLRRYLDQFPESLVEPMINLLEKITFLDRSELGTEFAGYLSSLLTTDRVCVPLSLRLTKSSSHIAYFLADQNEKYPIVSMQEALDGDKELLFIDECLISGSQARCILQSWFGLPKECEEDHGEPLPDDAKAKLLERRVAFHFCYATEDGIQNLRDLVRQLGWDVEVDALRKQPAGLRPLSNVLSENPELYEFLGKVGEQLLLSTKARENPTKWTQDRCRAFRLGYGGCEELLAFFYNVPTSTVTALWKAGDFDGAQWLPLFPRRRELSPDTRADCL